MGIVFSQKGDFSKFDSFAEKILDAAQLSKLDKYGRKGCDLLSIYTPVDTGTTANSWYYTIERRGPGVALNFHNSNIVNGQPIAILLQYGHGTGGGGYVVGVDYINPALKPIFENVLEECWKEVMMA